jgi:hypothetical protein
MYRHAVINRYKYRTLLVSSNPLIPRPPMIPSIPSREIRLQLCILDRHTSPHPPLDHRTPVQSPHIPALDTQRTCIRSLATSFCFTNSIAVAIQQSEVFACSPHRHVLAFKLEGLCSTAFTQEEHPSTVNSPMTKRTVAGEM